MLIFNAKYFVSDMIIKNRWKIINCINKGAFGVIFKVCEVTNNFRSSSNDPATDHEEEEDDEVI